SATSRSSVAATFAAPSSTTCAICRARRPGSRKRSDTDGPIMTPRSFFSGLWRGLDGLRKVLQLIVLLVIFAVFIAVLRGSVPRIPAKAALLVAPEGELVEQLSGEPVERALEEARGEGHAQTLLWDLTDSIRTAASDARIQAVA